MSRDWEWKIEMGSIFDGKIGIDFGWRYWDQYLMEKVVGIDDGECG